ncbi:FUSC family protein [Streptomyces parvulus]|uniref:FUSC family protein n=1 Tax=Streptomyces parvulus TaxID=146923 RepID=UPI00343EFC71
MVARLMPLLWDRLAVVDPGLTRLASAARAVLGAAASLAVLGALGESDTTLLVGGFTAMVTSLAISDLHPRNQILTLLLGAPAFLGAQAAGAVLAPHRAGTGIAFLVLIHLSVQARRYGARGQGVGVFGFMGFFLAQFTGARTIQLPEVGMAVLVAFGAVVAIFYCSGFMTASRVLHRLERSFAGRLRDVLDRTAALLAAEQNAEATIPSLERRLDRLHAVALLVDDLLHERAVDEDTDEQVLRHIARTEVAARRLTVLAVRVASTPLGAGDLAEAALRRRLASRIRALGRQVPRGAITEPKPQIPQGAADPPGIRPGAYALLQDCSHGVDELAESVSPGASASAAAGRHAPTVTPRARARHAGRRRASRQALRVTAASAASIVGGQLLSPDHWYWAVVATWVVFINTETTGEVILQSLRRLAGTVLGAVFGYGLATLAGPFGPLLLVLLLVCVFGIFYTPPNAYWAVTFFITSGLSMLFALQETFSADVLVLRVQETALGVCCGILATVLVLPVTVRHASDEELERFLLILSDLLHTAGRGVSAEATTSLIRTAHDLDRALESFRKACLPLFHPLNPQRGRGDRARHLLELMEAGAYHAKSLAIVGGDLSAGDESGCESQVAAAVQQAQERVRHLVRVAGHRPGAVTRSRPKVSGALSLLTHERRMSPGRGSPLERLLFHIDRLDATLIVLTRAMTPGGRAVGRAPCAADRGVRPSIEP